jgi:hypothetical protein
VKPQPAHRSDQGRAALDERDPKARHGRALEFVLGREHRARRREQVVRHGDQVELHLVGTELGTGEFVGRAPQRLTNVGP